MRTRRTGQEVLHTRVKQTKEVKEREVIEEQMEDLKTQVYVLEHYIAYEGTLTIGIYSSKEKAQAAKESYLVQHPDMTGTLIVGVADVDFSHWETVDVAGKRTRPSARVR